MEAMEERTSYVKPEEARKFAQGVLEGNGVPAGQARVVARCLVEADLRGVDTHGTFGFFLFVLVSLIVIEV
jgi:LDH2 family malate/lactate/ureidoglycolate dehydrogenase